MRLQSVTNDFFFADALSVEDAARLAGQPRVWIRQYLRFGQLEPADIDGRQAVSTTSLLALLQQLPKRERPKPRLVIDNT